MWQLDKSLENPVFEQSRYTASTERVLVDIEACKYEKRNRDGGHDDFLLNWHISCTMHTADLAFTASRLSQALLQESFTSKWWLSSKVAVWNFTKNKLLKLVNLM